MKVKQAIILSAGFGTRMGEIGKVLPKILWPIFSKSLLELQVLYLKEMGVEKIYINLHHQKDKILNYCSSIDTFNDVEFLIEEEILGVGGAIHNLASKVNYLGNLLIVNADQFCFFDKDYWEQAIEKSELYVCSLFATQVHKKHRYNETVLDKEGCLKTISTVGTQSTQWHLTYGGFGFVNLEKLNKHSGESNFFSHVADYKNNKIPMTVLPKDFEYWDYGTKERYFYQMQRIKKSQDSEFFKFLTRCGVVIDLKFYFEADGNSGLILKRSSNTGQPSYNFIAYEEIVEKIDINESLL